MFGVWLPQAINGGLQSQAAKSWRNAMAAWLAGVMSMANGENGCG
jgi:hypothetical protein